MTLTERSPNGSIRYPVTIWNDYEIVKHPKLSAIASSIRIALNGEFQIALSESQSNAVVGGRMESNEFEPAFDSLTELDLMAPSLSGAFTHWPFTGTLTRTTLAAHLVRLLRL